MLLDYAESRRSVLRIGVGFFAVWHSDLVRVSKKTAWFTCDIGVLSVQ